MQCSDTCPFSINSKSYGLLHISILYFKAVKVYSDFAFGSMCCYSDRRILSNLWPLLFPLVSTSNSVYNFSSFRTVLMWNKIQMTSFQCLVFCVHKLRKAFRSRKNLGVCVQLTVVSSSWSFPSLVFVVCFCFRGNLFCVAEWTLYLTIQKWSLFNIKLPTSALEFSTYEAKRPY